MDFFIVFPQNVLQICLDSEKSRIYTWILLDYCTLLVLHLSYCGLQEVLNYNYNVVYTIPALFKLLNMIVIIILIIIVSNKIICQKQHTIWFIYGNRFPAVAYMYLSIWIMTLVSTISPELKNPGKTITVIMCRLHVHFVTVVCRYNPGI